jgi:hypothetical protein
MANKGDYYRYKTKKWFQDLGYKTEYLEQRQRIYTKGKVIFVKRDLFASDGLSMNEDLMIFWQCKLNKKNIADAIKEFSKFPFPDSKEVERWIVVWEPRKREPEIIKVSKETFKPVTKF